jgi:hypothetical protein
VEAAPDLVVVFIERGEWRSVSKPCYAQFLRLFANLGYFKPPAFDLVQPVAPSLAGSRANVLCGAAVFADYEPLPFPP